MVVVDDIHMGGLKTIKQAMIVSAPIVFIERLCPTVNQVLKSRHDNISW